MSINSSKFTQNLGVNQLVLYYAGKIKSIYKKIKFTVQPYGGLTVSTVTIQPTLHTFEQILDKVD